MKIVFWGKGNRGVACLKKVIENNYQILLIVTDPNEKNFGKESILKIAEKHKIDIINPKNPNDKKIDILLKGLNPDLFILAGYGKIIKKNILNIPRIMCLNLHGGKLPQNRGSSPMNWVLIHGKKQFSISIIKLDEGVDTGDVLIERTFNIGMNDTIVDLHAIANKNFPEMLVELLSQIEKNTFKLKPQDESEASYYPLRFPDDGIIFWDVLTAEQIHNKIRALTDPYPGAFCYFQDKKVKLLESKIPTINYYGEPGRIYKIDQNNGLYVCAKDKCLLITKAVIMDSKEDIVNFINRYDKFSTISGIAQNIYEQKVSNDY